jgi:threonine synthase
VSLFKCVHCGRNKPIDDVYICKCGGLYDVFHHFEDITLDFLDNKLQSIESFWSSGVWRYKELIHPKLDQKFIVSRPEGNTNIYYRKRVSDYVDIQSLYMKHEGENPTGSFKDRGMTVGISVAINEGSKKVACASTGNTSASMAAYAAQAGLQGIVFIPEGMIAYGKLAQALAFGAKVIQVKGNFDEAMNLIKTGSKHLGFYILNSLNPWRIEGQKSIIFELLQQRRWNPPDWIAVPAGNLGNTAAFGKALSELKYLGLIDKIPRIASVQAAGANPFYRQWKNDDKKLISMKPNTLASAIKIGNPVNWEKALRSINQTNGTVEEVSDEEIMDAKAVIDASGIGCEPASAASVAGVKKLRRRGVINNDEDVVCILTGDLMKDSDITIQYHLGTLSSIKTIRSNKPIEVDPNLDIINAILQESESSIEEKADGV